MNIVLHCDRCNKKIDGIDEVLFLRHDTVSAWYATSLNRTATQIVADGENTILCEACRDEFYNFIKHKELIDDDV
jgi:hypothetical protein